MHCKDLLSMEQLKDSLHLVAGEQGLGRSVRVDLFCGLH